MAQLFTATHLSAKCNISLEDAQECIAQFDAEGDGTLTIDEFDNLVDQISAQISDDRMSALDLADACNLTEQEAAQIIDEYDPEGDGFLELEEFEDLKQQISSQQQMPGDAMNAVQPEEAAEETVSSEHCAPEENGNPTAGPSSSKRPSDSTETAPKQHVDFPAAIPMAVPLEENPERLEQEKERLRRIQRERVQRQKQQQQQYDEHSAGGDDDDDDDDHEESGQGQKFKHQWKFGMNFDPKTKSVVIYVSDAVTAKKWGLTLTDSDFAGSIRTEYRKLGGTLQSGTIKYEYPPGGVGELGVEITGPNQERYSYRLPQQ